MIMKKHVLVAVLVTFCLTFVLFGISPTRSASNPYDPWLDTNDDGVINMRDIGAACSAFGASGDPAKNVTIAGHANKLVIAASQEFLDVGQYFDSAPILVDGYSKVSINVYLTNSGIDYYLLCSHEAAPAWWFEVDYRRETDWAGFSKTYDVMNKYLFIKVFNIGSLSSLLSIDVYLIP